MFAQHMGVSSEDEIQLRPGIEWLEGRSGALDRET